MIPPVLDLTAGSVLVLNGAAWTVEHLEPQYGTVVLTGRDGQRLRVSVRFLISHPDCRLIVAVRCCGRCGPGPPARDGAGSVTGAA